MSDSVCLMPAAKLAECIRRREVSSEEATSAFFERIDHSGINAYVTLLQDSAIATARSRDLEVSRGELHGPLHGVPIAVKDLEPLSGVKFMQGCPALKDLIADDDGIAIARLKAAGAVILGKTNVPEFGHKGVTDNRLTGPCHTPFKQGRNAGGSSGGSAASVSAGLASVAQGGDGGGSIRIPAALSGCYGLKPSWGRVPDRKVSNAFGSLLCISLGPLTRTVGDAAIMLDVLAGPSPLDPLSLPTRPESYHDLLNQTLNRAKILFNPSFDSFPVEPEVDQAVNSAVMKLSDAGFDVEVADVGLPDDSQALAHVWKQLNGLLYLEVFRDLAESGFDLLKTEGALEEGVKEQAHLGAALSARDLLDIWRIRTAVFDSLEAAFDSYDYIITPTLAVASVPNAGDGLTVGPSVVAGRSVDSHIGWCLTFPVNFSGHPSASVPIGLSKDGCPIGLQIIGPMQRDDRVLALSSVLEDVIPWYQLYENLEGVAIEN